MNIKTLLILGLSLVCFSQCAKNTTSPSNNTSTSVSVTALSCGSVSYSATATASTAYSATATLAYSGGNGATYSNGAATSSTGVTGLTATIQAGTLKTGAGNLSIAISGTPSSAGTATFPISFGGQSCSYTLTVNASSGGLTVPAPYNKIYGASSITYDGTYVTIKTVDLPDHPSCYYPTTNSLYQAFSGPTVNGDNFVKNPNSIVAQTITMKIPANPVVATNHAATPLGAIGIALDGVPFFNQYAAGGVALTTEIYGFDQYYGHPQNSGMYHYHLEPLYLTTVKGTKSSLVGFLLDGFPVYGPQEADGSTPTGLDNYHGHTHATAEYPSGIYHYHAENSAPYINGDGFYGTAGTVSQ